MEWFTASIGQFGGEAKHLQPEPEIYRPGRFHDREVVELLFFDAENGRAAAKLVLLAGGHEFRPLIFNSGDLYFEHASIVSAANTTFLVNRDRISGTAAEEIESYFVLDESQGVPINVPFDEVIRTRLRTLLPAGKGVWKGGGFDVGTLRFTKDVWKNGDANCCPTAGTVTIQLALKDNRPVVVSAKYKPRADVRR